MPPRASAARLLHHIRRLAAPPSPDPGSDADLLTRYLTGRDEAAFAAIVARHGPMVLRVCRRALADAHAAEDCYQATFLVLARKAASVRRRGSLAAWLYGVAARVSRRARDAGRRRAAGELRSGEGPADPRPDPLDLLTARELLDAVDEEVERLPEVYRLPVVLCCMEGRPREEAARLLGWTEGSVKGRLERGRARLHDRLLRRGLTLTAALAAVELSRAAAPAAAPTLAAAAARAAILFASGQAAAPAAASARTLTLAQGVLNAMMRTRLLVVTAVLTLALLGGATGVLAFAAGKDQGARTPPPAAAPDPAADAEAGRPEVGDGLDALILVEGADGDGVAYRRTQAVLVRSRAVLAAALRAPGADGLKVLKGKDDAAGWLDRNLSVSFVEDSAVLRVGVGKGVGVGEGEPAERAALANAVARAYLDVVVGEEQKRKEERLRTLEDTLEDQEKALRAMRDKAHKLGVEEEAPAASLRRQFAEEDLARLRDEYHRVHLEKIAAQARLNYRKGTGDAGKEAVAKLEEDVGVLAEQERLLKAEIDPLAEEAQKLAAVDGSQSAEASRLRDEIAAAEEAVRRTAGEVEAARSDLRSPPRVRLIQEAESPGRRD
jgi:RNA polymerase sigma factor (sigma-70 family)